MYTERIFQNLLDYWAEIKPDSIACFDEFGDVTYREMASECNSLALALALKGIGQGDRVVTFMKNGHEFVTLFFAVAKLGAILVPCNPALEKCEIENRLADLSPKAIFLTEERGLDFISKDLHPLTVTVRFSRKGYLNFNDLAEMGKSKKTECFKIDVEESLFAVMYTSGSTCKGKGAMLTYNNMFHGAVSIGGRLECTDNDIFLVPLPVSHMFCIIVGILVPFYFGCKVVLMNRFEPKRALDLIENHRATVLLGVPTMFIRELHEQKEEKRELSSLRTGVIAGSSFSGNLIQQIESQMHCRILVGYGSTETVSISMTSLYDEPDKRHNTVGRPFPGMTVKLIRDDGSEAAIGESGEILCKGIGVMKGYYNLESENCRIFDNEGWLHTGDLAVKDEDGYLKIIGRKTDIIIRGGYNVTPSEIENVFCEHPDVMEICAVGRSHKELGEQICLFVRLKQGSSETVDSLRDYIKKRVAKYKHPDCIYILESIPKLESGKYDRLSLLKILNVKGSTMNTLVCYKVVYEEQDITVKPDSTLSFDRAEMKLSLYDLNAVEEAVRIAEATGGSVKALSAGDDKLENSKLKKGVLSRGPQELFLVKDPALKDLDTNQTAKILAAGASKIGFDLILCGEGSADDYSQQTGVQLGEMLGVPVINAVSKITIQNGSLLVERTQYERHSRSREKTCYRVGSFGYWH
jgi:fatty-acyl-CoA synthase/long-chain acyl-CoA synthetase